MLALIGSTESADPLARLVAAAGLGVALLSLALNWLIWRRSRPRLKVKLSADPDNDPMQTRFVIEVVSVGRLAVVVRSLGVRDHIVVQQATGNSTQTSLLSLEVEPTSGKLPLTLDPTEFLVAEVSMEVVVNRWDADKKMTLVAWALSGDGKRYESKPLKIQTARRPRS